MEAGQFYNRQKKCFKKKMLVFFGNTASWRDKLKGQEAAVCANVDILIV